MNVKIEDHTIEVINAIGKSAVAFLHGAKSEIASQASDLSPAASGTLARSFIVDSEVDEKNMKAIIGSTVRYALWQELGTGEYAHEGNGRKGGWVYYDEALGKKVFTRGTKPKRMLHHAFQQKKGKLDSIAKKAFGGL